MDRFIGVKEINAKPMSRQEYNEFRGWDLPEDENGADEGCLVEYIDGGKANTKEYSGYVSWSPKEVFEKAYRPVEGMTFGLAVEALKKGKKIARAGWNGKGMWLCMMSGMKLSAYSSQEPGNKVNDRTAALIGEDTPFETLPYISMWTADKKWLPGWLASQTDILAEDWEVVE